MVLMWRPIFIAVMQRAVVNNRAIAWYRNRYRLVTILGGIVAPWYIAIYWGLFDTGIETSVLTILIEVSKVLHNATLNHTPDLHCKAIMGYCESHAVSVCPQLLLVPHSRNDLFCIGWDVKPYSLTHSLC